MGWVAIVRGGRPLVSSKVRLDVADRRSFEQQWARRLEVDRARTRQEEDEREAEKRRALRAAQIAKDRERRRSREMTPAEGEEDADPLAEAMAAGGDAADGVLGRGGGGADGREQASLHQKMVRSLAMELAGARRANDLSAFAFGGVYPGVLHAHGKLLESHKVSFSVGVAGQYLLHVRLRQQAAPIPGSPFLLEVRPGPAHALSTRLPERIEGEVGGRCSLLIQTADMMGNRCLTGGANLQLEVSSKAVTALREDLGDGSYRLIFNAERTGTFRASVLIDGIHVANSPSVLQITSTVPDLSQCRVVGPQERVVRKRYLEPVVL